MVAAESFESTMEEAVEMRARCFSHSDTRLQTVTSLDVLYPFQYPFPLFSLRLLPS